MPDGSNASALACSSQGPDTHRRPRAAPRRRRHRDRQSLTTFAIASLRAGTWESQAEPAVPLLSKIYYQFS